MLIGITEHKIHTLGKIYVTINMDRHIIKTCILCGERWHSYWTRRHSRNRFLPHPV